MKPLDVNPLHLGEIPASLATKAEGVHGWQNTIYGKLWLDSMQKLVHKWTFKLSGKSSIIFGFVTKCKHHNKDYTADKVMTNYGRASAGGIWENGRWIANARNPLYVDLTDTFKIVLDLVNGIIIHDFDGKAEIIHKDILQNEDTRYKLAISLLDSGTDVTLIKYDREKVNSYHIPSLMTPFL